MNNFTLNLSKFLKIPSNLNEIFFFTLIACLIFITVGDNIIDYVRILILKIILIIYIIAHLDLEFYKKIKLDIITYKNTSILLSLFIISVTLSYIFSPYEISDFAFQWVRVRYLHIVSDIALFITFFLYFKKNGVNYNYLAYSIIIPGIIFSIIIFFSIVFNKEILNSPDQMIFFDGIRQAGMMLGVLIILISSYIFVDYNQKTKLIGFFFITLIFILLFLFQGRGDFLSIILTYFLTFIFFYKIKKKFKTNFIILITILLISFLISQFIMSYVVTKMNYIDPIKFEIQELKGLLDTSGRIELWKYTINKYLENPILGKGPGSFFIMSFIDVIYNDHPFEKAPSQPHNMILQFLIEWGIIGTSIILILLIKILIKCLGFLIKYKKLILLIPGLTLIKLTIHGMIDGTFFHPTFTFIIVLLLSILCFEVRKIHRL